MKNKIIGILCLSCLLFVGPAQAQSLTPQEVIELAKLVQTLRAENESYQRQIALLEEGLHNSSKVVAELSLQTQALLELQDARNAQADKVMYDLMEINRQSFQLIERAEKKIHSQEKMTDFWRVATIALGVYAGTK